MLGSMNLSEYVDNKEFDFNQFAKDVGTAVIGLNEVLDEGLPLHPLQEQRDSVKKWRQIGLGIMGLADMLIKMELPYDSNEAIALCNQIGSIMINAALQQSAELARVYGTYPKYNNKVLESTFFTSVATTPTIQQVSKYGLRNSQLLTCAPTGTLSTMLGISGGIEPIFANSYTRKTESLHGKDVYYKVYTPIVNQYMEANGLTEEEQLPEWFVTSATIDPIMRIKMQGTWQSFIDASISSTVNLPHQTAIEEVEELYMAAWENGLKGLTIFRDGCERVGILTTNQSNLDKAEQNHILGRGDIIECSSDLIGKKRKLTTGCGSLHVLAFFDPANGDMQEVYLNKGSTGGCANFMTGLSRTISLLCRAGVDVYTIKDQLDSTGVCPSYATRTATKHDTSKGSCCPMAIGNALVEMWREMQSDIGDDWESNLLTANSQNNQDCQYYNDIVPYAICPECGEPLIFEGGCNSCRNCGYSKCN